MTAPFDPAAVSSLAEVLANQAGGLTFIAAVHLPLWLPDLAVQNGWEPSQSNGAPVTRMLLRRLDGENRWDACEVINLYRVPGAVPESLVVRNADRTLRDSGATAINTQQVAIPPHYGVTGARTSGELRVGPHKLRTQYTHYAVNTPNGGALIEQIVLVLGEAYTPLRDELKALNAELQRALLASIDRATQMRTAHAPVDTASHQRVALLPQENQGREPL